MSSATPVNPVEIARIALKRLAERGMAPTPENYTQFYNAIVTIKSPESKNKDELQLAWEVLFRLDDLVSDARQNTTQLLEVLADSNLGMANSLGNLKKVRKAHVEGQQSAEESHSALEELLGQIIDSTQNVHSSVLNSHQDLQTIRESLQHIEQDISISRQLAEQDVLTGTLNRQSIEHLLLREVRRAQRSAGKLAVILFELDELGTFSSRLGASVSDEILVHLANLTKAVLRDSDMLARFSSEEFLLLLPETDSSSARYVMDRIKLVASNTPFIYRNQRFELRVSAGIATLKENENGRAMVLRADEALDRAKHSGRGRVELAN